METNNLSLEKLFEELAKTNRKIGDLQRTIETLDDDRQILESIQGRLTSLEEQVRLARAHDGSVSKDIKQEVQIAGDRVTAAVETQVEQIKNMVGKKKVTLRRPGSLLARLIWR